MSSTVTVIGGVHQGRVQGLISVPLSSGLPPASVKNLQSLLASIGADVIQSAGQAAQINVGGLSGPVGVPTVPATGTNVLEFSASVNGGSGTAGASISASVPVGYHAVVVQAPGVVTLNAASSSGSTYLLGADSRVKLNAGGGFGSIVAGGGADSLNLSGAFATSIIGGATTVAVDEGADTIDAYGGAQTSVLGSALAHTTLRFINHSTGSATVLGGGGSVTIFSGAGAGVYQAGTGGNSSLVSGAGPVQLLGRSGGDVLEAGVSTGGAIVSGIDVLVAGAGNETLLASAATGANQLFAGSGQDTLRSDGAGIQDFFGGAGSATMTGSTQPDALNFFVFGAASSSGGNGVITNFDISKDFFISQGNATIRSITPSNSASGLASLVKLSDGTSVLLQGVNPTQAQSMSDGRVF